MALEVGTGISSGVAKQLEARKKVIGKIKDRTNDDLMYMNGKTGWVKLSSGVNTVTDPEVAEFREQKGRLKIKGDNTLAKNNILFGGLMSPDGKPRAGIETSGNVDETKAYLLRPSTGFRPMAGITSMTVKSKNTYGTLREAEVKFSVWSLEEFEVMERLYLRPGFTMLLEWGHSLYINNDGVLQTTIKTINSDTFFKPGQEMSKITDAIKEIREESNYNYEGMVGYCKNFSWNYNSNGGYDCSVSIISTGEILESAPVKLSPGNLIPADEMDSATSDEGKEQRKSIFHYFLQKLALVTQSVVRKGDLATYAPSLAAPLQNFTVFWEPVEIDDSWIWDTEAPMHWVPLGLVLDIYNNFVAIKDLTKKSGSPSATMCKFNTDIKKSTKFITGPKHFSPDPLVCVLLAPNDEGLGILPFIHATTQNMPEEETSDVLNIFINSLYLKSKFDEALDTDGKFNKSMSDILKSILDGISTALGGINDFDIAYDDEDEGGTFYVIDRNLTPEANPPAELTLVGVDSIFREVSISSKITNETSSQIAIAAQGTTQNYSENVENMLKWNPNIIDRIVVTKDVQTKNKDGEDAVKADQEEILQDWKDSIITFFSDFSGGGYDKDELEAVKTEHAHYTVENVIRRPASGTDAGPSPIPVELTLKLDGIGGFKIASTFRISSGLLPDKYNGKFGYIITGLEHSIGTNSVWETSVTTQFYLLAQLKQEARQPQVINPAPAPSPKQNTVAAADYIPPGEIQPGEDPAPIINPKRVGAAVYGASQLAKDSSKNGGQNGLLDLKNRKLLVFIGETNGARNYYINPATKQPEYMLHPAAAKAWQAWKADMKAAGVPYRMTSAYRNKVHQEGLGTGTTIAGPGSSPHGWGGALDFGNLHAIVGGSGSPKRNKEGRKVPIYKQMATLGAKHGWYNPWRLSDGAGKVDEMWHFEYWGPV
ncbi:carboxypeptidase [Flavobacterium phage vB_FspM_immuto_3-5A]|uniref:Carboxypeptidase n=1 Tax=Flavobacterium phage vB_FspM_immuto_2-6A TaxID=2801477 RepID=A0A7T8ESC3_9CAUD|nr:carboxypeptidase [Flavobacterium phage vB_FspM_immuto_2-6A]QQO91917.1 carboxypeptidase [Flavobacterium phage vB_FspM_immuto_2-6A]QQO92155.1 carboxypeptidase [Flavobacterium phage vB_FspM_immuto_3-5A]QQO92393.1 carboxypeptidase [Flavobacterium phage vB_FspM_immuto_13-6C]